MQGYSPLSSLRARVIVLAGSGREEKPGQLRRVRQWRWDLLSLLLSVRSEHAEPSALLSFLFSLSSTYELTRFLLAVILALILVDGQVLLWPSCQCQRVLPPSWAEWPVRTVTITLVGGVVPMYDLLTGGGRVISLRNWRGYVLTLFFLARVNLLGRRSMKNGLVLDQKRGKSISGLWARKMHCSRWSYGRSW